MPPTEKAPVGGTDRELRGHARPRTGAGAMEIREKLDTAMREWVERGYAAESAFSEACNAKPRDEARIKEAFSALDASHDSECRAHNEGLRCCLEHEHKMYGAMLDFLVIRLAAT
jgi:hypothetical protein